MTPPIADSASTPEPGAVAAGPSTTLTIFSLASEPLLEPVAEAEALLAGGDCIADDGDDMMSSALPSSNPGISV